MRIVYKEIGETPLEAIERFRKEQAPTLDGVPLSYAGRLDPMAEGLLLVLMGEENKEREKYLNRDKTYEVEILLGLTSDTYDVLGEVNIGNIEKIDTLQKDELIESIGKFLKSIEGEFVQQYPPYSSKPVQGKPLFEWARARKLDEIEIPTKIVQIYQTKLLQVKQMPFKEIINTAITNISKVKGDFRQELCVESWQRVAKKYINADFFIAKIEISCGSGTYMRSIAHELGKKIGYEALAFSIKRTKI